MKTCPCNVFPLLRQFYRFLRVPTIYVLSKIKKIIKILYLKFFIFTTVKNRCLLHGHVFVMNVGIKRIQKLQYLNYHLQRIDMEIIYLVWIVSVLIY